MTPQAKCNSCGSAMNGAAKFCPSCGTKVVVQNLSSAVTLSSVIEHLRENGDELDNGVFRLLMNLAEGRSQLVFVLPLRDSDGDHELDDLCIWSNFAGVEEVALKAVIEADAGGFGIQKIGDFFAIQTSIRPWQLRELDALSWILTRVGIVADLLEDELLGSDGY